MQFVTHSYLNSSVYVITLGGRSCILWFGLLLNSGCGKWIDVVLVIDDKHLYIVAYLSHVIIFVSSGISVLANDYM